MKWYSVKNVLGKEIFLFQSISPIPEHDPLSSDLSPPIRHAQQTLTIDCCVWKYLLLADSFSFPTLVAFWVKILNEKFKIFFYV